MNVTFISIADGISAVIAVVIPILFVLATIVFLWGVIRFITAAGDEKKITEGKNIIIWGLVGLFVMVAVWGIVQLFVKFLFPGGLPPPLQPPDLPGAT